MKKRISVFEIIADSSLTGAPRHLLTLINGMNRVKFITTVIAPPGPLVEQLKKRKIPVFQVPMQGRSYVPAVNAVKKLLVKYDPDVVHTHGQRAGLIGRLAVQGLPIKVVHTEHTYTHQFRLGNPILHLGHLRGMRMLDRYTNKVIAVSKAVKKFLLDAKITKPDKVVAIYNGITPLTKKISDTEIRQFRDKYHLSEKDVVIGTVGSFNIQKDTATLIKATAKMVKKWPKIKLVLVGKGPLKYKLEKLVKKLHLEDNIIFTGSLNNVLPALKTFDVFVLPSRSEAFGISVLEAMKAGVPIVASKVGGIPEIITHNHSGLLVEPGDVKQLASTLMKLLNDKKLQRKLTGNHRKTVERFSADTMVKQTEAVYSSLFKK